MRHRTAVNGNGSNFLSVIRTRVALRALPLPVPSDAVDFAGAIAAYERLMRRADNLECVNAEVVQGAVGHRVSTRSTPPRMLSCSADCAGAPRNGPAG